MFVCTTSRRVASLYAVLAVPSVRPRYRKSRIAVVPIIALSRKRFERFGILPVTFLSHDRVRKPRGMRASTCHDDETEPFHKREAERARSRAAEKNNRE